MNIYRKEFRGTVRADVLPADVKNAAKKAEESASLLREKGVLMTVGLYYFERQLFLYYETTEETLMPEAFLKEMAPYLLPWPEKGDPVLWAPMYPIYWHSVPKSVEEWVRPKEPTRRVGRIALLKHETMFEYVYHHFAIVREGVFKGDRYQFISLHEDMLFSYYEEPRTNVCVREESGELPRTEPGSPEEPVSEALKAWVNTDPGSHFVPLPGSNGANFLELPAYFILG